MARRMSHQPSAAAVLCLFFARLRGRSRCDIKKKYSTQFVSILLLTLRPGFVIRPAYIQFHLRKMKQKSSQSATKLNFFLQHPSVSKSYIVTAYLLPIHAHAT